MILEIIVKTVDDSNGCKGCIFENQSEVSCNSFDHYSTLNVLGLPSCGDGYIYLKGELSE